MPLSWSLGTLTSWKILGHSRPVTALLYLFYWMQIKGSELWIQVPGLAVIPKDPKKNRARKTSCLYQGKEWRRKRSSTNQQLDAVPVLACSNSILVEQSWFLIGQRQRTIESCDRRTSCHNEEPEVMTSVGMNVYLTVVRRSRANSMEQSLLEKPTVPQRVYNFPEFYLTWNDKRYQLDATIYLLL